MLDCINKFKQKLFSVEINFWVCVMCLILLAMTINCHKNFDSLEQFYIMIFIILIIFISSLTDFYFKDSNKEKFQNIDLNLDKLLKNKNCYSRSKEYSDYKRKIDKRLDDERHLEENDRQDVELNDEIKKIYEMGDLNLDYLANGENF